VPWFVAAAATESSQPARGRSDKTLAHEKRLEAFHDRLVANPENPGIDPELAGLVNSLLDFYRRAAKPQWWAIFDRREMELEELIEDPEVIAGLYDPGYVGEGERYEMYRYRYLEQDFKVRSGDRPLRLDNLKESRVWTIDEDENTVELEFRLGKEELEPPATMSVSIGAPVDTSTMQGAVFDFAESLVQGGKQYKAVRDYLQRRTPDIRRLEPGQPLVGTDATPLDAAISAVERLDSSYLFIQGPPGTGKTYTGSHLIAFLLKAGKRVAVSSNSHRPSTTCSKRSTSGWRNPGMPTTG
jgi:uncharacterized protein